MIRAPVAEAPAGVELTRIWCFPGFKGSTENLCRWETSPRVSLLPELGGLRGWSRGTREGSRTGDPAAGYDAPS
ncbi:hypothetical protein GCM10010495_06630 [Kitasatospora herbaricolor]|nr:hypothetical protein GCM10010495_06630 [Kitasatospora herbaricolor]